MPARTRAEVEAAVAQTFPERERREAAKIDYRDVLYWSESPG